MPRRSDARLTALVLGSVLVLAGCAGATQPAEPAPSPTHIDLDAWDEETSGNGIVLLDATTARATVLTAVREAGPATMTGTFTSGGRALTIDVHGSSEETVAQFTVDGQTTVVVSTDGQTYLNPTAATAGEAGSDRPVGEFSCVADDDPAVTRWGALLHPLQALAEHTSDASALGAPSDDGVDLILGADGTQGALRVQTQGPALPVSLTRADAAGSVQLEFSGWGEAVDLPDLEAAAGC